MPAKIGNRMLTAANKLLAKAPKVRSHVYRYWVYCSSEGNPDYNQWTPISPKAIAFANTLSELRSCVGQYIEKWDLGGGNCPGFIVGEGRTIVGYFSYNGRLWEGLPGDGGEMREIPFDLEVIRVQPPPRSTTEARIGNEASNG